jgi:Arc/MetJ family transcription regulator
MKASIEIDDKLLEEAMRLTQARTKEELIHLSLLELIRQKRRERLRARLGRTEIALTLDDLQRMREDE